MYALGLKSVTFSAHPVEVIRQEPSVVVGQVWNKTFCLTKNYDTDYSTLESHVHHYP